MSENIKMWFENALDIIDPITYPELHTMIQCGYLEFLDFDKQRKEDFINMCEKVLELEMQMEDIGVRFG